MGKKDNAEEDGKDGHEDKSKDSHKSGNSANDNSDNGSEEEEEESIVFFNETSVDTSTNTSTECSRRAWFALGDTDTGTDDDDEVVTFNRSVNEGAKTPELGFSASSEDNKDEEEDDDDDNDNDDTVVFQTNTVEYLEGFGDIEEGYASSPLEGGDENETCKRAGTENLSGKTKDNKLDNTKTDASSDEESDDDDADVVLMNFTGGNNEEEDDENDEYSHSSNDEGTDGWRFFSDESEEDNNNSSSSSSDYEGEDEHNKKGDDLIIGEETMMSLPQHLEQPHKATAATPTPTLPKEVVPTVMTIPPLSSTLSEHTTKNSDGSDDDDDDDSTVVIVGGGGNSVVISSSSSSSSNSSNANENNNDVYNVVKAARAVKASLRGAGDVNLVRRERELTYLRDYLTACRFADMPGCFYVSGPPGTGKTTAVIRVVSSLNIAAPGNWTVVNVDCIKLAKAGPAELFRGLSRQLELRCSKQQQQQQRAVEERLCRADLPPVVMIVDEADALFSRGVRRRLLFTIFTFPLLRGSRCIVIAVANASRPPASFWKKLRSRIGIWRVHFGPYSAEDLEAIAAARIASVPCSAEVITPTALHAIAVRLAVTCGDARRMLMLTCAAVDNALARITRSNNDSIGDNNNNNNNCPLVQKADVDAAVEEMLMADARSAGIATLPPHLAVLLAVVARRCSIFGVQLDQECVHPPRRDRGWAGVGEVVCDAVQAWAQFATPNAPGDSTQEVVLALRLLQQTGLVRMAAEARRGYTPPEMWKVQATIDQETLLASLKDQNAASMLLS